MSLKQGEQPGRVGEIGAQKVRLSLAWLLVGWMLIQMSYTQASALCCASGFTASSLLELM